MPITRPTLSGLWERGVRDGGTDTPTWGRDDVSTTRRFFVPWDQREDLAKYFLGDVQIAGDIVLGPTRLERLTPLEHPVYSRMYATRITVHNNHAVLHGDAKEVFASDSSTAAKFRMVEFSVTYERLKYSVQTDLATPIGEEYRRWLEGPEPQGANDVLNVPTGSCRYVGVTNNIPVPYGFNVNQPMTKLTYVWRQLPANIYQLYSQGGATPWQKRIEGNPGAASLALGRSYQGTINKDWYLGRPVGSLYLESVRMVQRPAQVDHASWVLPIYWDVYFEFLFKGTPGGRSGANWASAWNSLYFHRTSLLSGASGYYYVSRESTPTFRSAGTESDGDSLYDCRYFRHLTDVRISPP